MKSHSPVSNGKHAPSGKHAHQPAIIAQVNELLKKVDEARQRMHEMLAKLGINPEDLHKLSEFLRSDQVPKKHQEAVRAECNRLDQEMKEHQAAWNSRHGGSKKSPTAGKLTSHSRYAV